MSGHEDKGRRYISILNTARVNGAWDEFPELIRKITKHAPEQKTLIQTATAEHYISTYTVKRPQTASKQSDGCLQELRQTLSAATNTLSEETFQGQTCLAWAAWTSASKDSVSLVGAADVVQLFDRYGQKNTSSWTKICLLKATYFEVRTRTQEKEHEKAVALLRPASAWIELNSDLVKSVPQLAYWAEQILAEYGTFETSASSEDARLGALKAWSALNPKRQEIEPRRYGNTSSHMSGLAIWRSYYSMLSRKLSHGDMPQPRSDLAIDLRRVESAYETAFLKNRKFPQATESNETVEKWVEQVISNWQILCGPDWREDDIGPGGRNGVTRNVLDILYRAAMKTFHSTLILRRLFQVHKALTEFELAYKCLDTYIELVDRGRERAEKAGVRSSEPEEIMLLVVSEAIEGLCSFGGQQEAQKAFDLANKLQAWIDEIVPEHANGVPNGHTPHIEPANSVEIPGESLQTIYRAVGIAKAHWGRWTPFSESRSELLADAHTALLKATSVSQPHLQTLYALALLCAETRDIPQAISITKLGLEALSQSDTAIRNRAQCALWHLMTLLLTSQQDFDTAVQSCAAVLDSILSLHSSSPTNGAVEKGKNESSAHSADDLECDDLQRITELQITYLALIELVDSPEAALNHSSELLSLYSKLFKRFDVGNVKVQQEKSPLPPKSSAGTTKGSIFSRKKPVSSIAPSATTTSLRSTGIAEKSSRPATQASQAPAIQVTDETGESPHRKHHHLSLRHHQYHGERETKRLSKDGRPVVTQGMRKSADMESRSAVSTVSGVTPADTDSQALHSPPTRDVHDSDPDAKQSLGEVAHNIAAHEKAPPPVGHDEQPPEQDVRLPNLTLTSTATSPIPRFPRLQAQKHALVVLHKLWLTIATLYRRCCMFDDAREALEEATKIASRIEGLVATTDSSARVLAEAGWGGGGKSSDEVWADIHSAKAELLFATAEKRAEDGLPTTSDTMRDIVEQYEHCLMYYPNHAGGIIGLSKILLDYYDRKVDLAKKVDDGRSYRRGSMARSSKDDEILGPTTPSQENLVELFSPRYLAGEDLRKTPENLNRLAARDRAYGLLNTLTKLGNGWDSSEAWFGLARAHELGGEIERSKKILWWCIELEDTRPIRHWSNLGCGGYIL